MVTLNRLGLEVTHGMFAYTSLASTSPMALN